MADINKRSGDGCDDEGGGERGKRGKRGHRGHRGHDGGATGFATLLVGMTDGPAALFAVEFLPAGSVIAPGSAVLALASTGTTPGPRSNVIGLVPRDTPIGAVTDYTIAGPLTLDTGIWDGVTGGSGGLIPNAAYYLSQTTLGHMTPVKPSSGQIVKVGVAFSPSTFQVQINETFQGPDGPPGPTGSTGPTGTTGPASP